MLVRSGRQAEPGIVSDIEDETRSLSLVDDHAGEDRLVADRHGDGRQPADSEVSAALARFEAARHVHELPEPEVSQARIDKMRKILAEGNEMALVVGFRDGAVVHHDLDGVEETRPLLAG